MRRYEVVFVLAPTLADDQVQEAIDGFSKIASDKGAEIVSVDNWGKRRLAFPVKKFTDGIYVVLTLEEPAAQAAAELERRFKVTDSVIRFLTVRVDLDLKRAAKFKARREEQKKQRRAASAAAAAAQSGAEERVSE